MPRALHALMQDANHADARWFDAVDDDVRAHQIQPVTGAQFDIAMTDFAVA
jgi:hypothetical protein